MTGVSVVVPVACDGAERDRNWQFIRDVYEHNWPEWEIIEAPDDGEADWSKGRAVNRAVERSSGRQLVIADSDLYVDPDALMRALLMLVCGAPWVVPYTTVLRLDERSTVRVLAGFSDARVVHGRRHKGPAGGGIVVLTRDAFDQVGGIDPRFTMWGGEDISFGRALDTLVGPHVRLDGTVWHLWHEPMPRYPGRRASPSNERLAGLYLDAEGNRDEMERLCAR